MILKNTVLQLDKVNVTFRQICVFLLRRQVISGFQKNQILTTANSHITLTQKYILLNFILSLKTWDRGITNVVILYSKR